MKIVWIGHSCFRLEQDGYVIVTDPYEDGSVPGLGPVRETADLVLCSHEHFDHNARGNVTLRDSAQAPACPFTVTRIDTWHDDQQGALRGGNAILLIETAGFRMAHLGDLGCGLTEEQAGKLKDLDLLLIPVGGHFTIDGAQASALVDKLTPRHVVPMHFRDDGLGTGFAVISTAGEFLERRDSAVCLETSGLDTDCLPDEQVIVLRPAMASAGA